MAEICKRVNVTITQRQDFERFIGNKVRPFVEQPSLFMPTVEDEKDFGKHRAFILELLRERRSQGAYNFELVKPNMMNHTARISELREQGYRITCRRVEGRQFLYILAPEHW